MKFNEETIKTNPKTVSSLLKDPFLRFFSWGNWPFSLEVFIKDWSSSVEFLLKWENNGKAETFDEIFDLSSPKLTYGNIWLGTMFPPNAPFAFCWLTNSCRADIIKQNLSNYLSRRVIKYFRQSKSETRINTIWTRGSLLAVIRWYIYQCTKLEITAKAFFAALFRAVKLSRRNFQTQNGISPNPQNLFTTPFDSNKLEISSKTAFLQAINFNFPWRWIHSKKFPWTTKIHFLKYTNYKRNKSPFFCYIL